MHENQVQVQGGSGDSSKAGRTFLSRTKTMSKQNKTKHKESCISLYFLMSKSKLLSAEQQKKKRKRNEMRKSYFFLAESEEGKTIRNKQTNKETNKKN